MADPTEKSQSRAHGIIAGRLRLPHVIGCAVLALLLKKCSSANFKAAPIASTATYRTHSHFNAHSQRAYSGTEHPEVLGLIFVLCHLKTNLAQ